MTRRVRRTEMRRWFGADIIWRIDSAIEEWARRRREPGSSRSAPRDLDDLLGHGRRWWPRIRSGERRAESGLCFGEIQQICDIIEIEPEEVIGYPSPLWALRGLAAEARKSSQQRGGRKPRRRKKEGPLDTALRLRRQGDIGGAAMLLVEELEREQSSEGWVHASYLLGSAGRLRSAIGAAKEGYMRGVLYREVRGQARSLLALANAYYAMAAYSEAEAAYATALVLKQDLQSLELFYLYQCRGRNLRELGRTEAAIISLGQALDHAQTSVQRTFAWWLQGDLHQELGQKLSALAAYRHALELSLEGRSEVSAVDRAHLLSLVGVTAFEAGQEDVGRELFPIALRLLDELSRTAPEAEAVLAAAHNAAARGERAAAWKQAETALAAIRNQLSSRPRRQA